MTKRVSDATLDRLIDYYGEEVADALGELKERRAADKSLGETCAERLGDLADACEIIYLRNQVCEAIGWEKQSLPDYWQDGHGDEWNTGDLECAALFHPDQRPKQLAMTLNLAGLEYSSDADGFIVARGDGFYETDPIEILRLIAWRAK